jgi:hypothetical protein
MVATRYFKVRKEGRREGGREGRRGRLQVSGRTPSFPPSSGT